MLSNQTAIIAQTDALPLKPVGPSSVTEWGLLGAMSYLCAQKAWQMFNRKEASEEQLISKLVDGLRENQTHMLAQMAQSADRTHQDIRELKEAVMSLMAVTREEYKDQNREISEIKASIMRLEQELRDRRVN